MKLKQDFSKRYGPWAIVTGASSGIGKEFAGLLAARGLNLLLIARRAHLLEELASKLHESYQVKIVSLPADLSDPDFMQSLKEKCGDKDIGLVICNAGFGLKGMFHKTSITKVSSMLDLNCRAPVLLAHTFIPKLLKRGQGGFLMTGSLEGFLGFPGSSSYSATKSFIHSFGEGLWGELKDHNIDILVLAPGSTDTENLSRQNINKDRLTHIMHPRKVAELALERLGKGPVYIPGILNRILMRLLLLLPRKLAIIAVGKGIKMSRY